MTQEQAIQEAKIKKIQNALAIKSGWSSWEDMWNDYFHDEHKRPFDSKEDESNFKQKIIQVAIEYSSSQLEAKDREIARLTKENKLLRSDGYEKEITELKSQLQQATASSSSKDPDAVCERCHKKVYLSYIMREEGLCFCDHPKLPPSSTKRFSLEDIQKIIDDWFKSSNENTTYLAHLILQFVVPSEHTEVKEVVMGRNSSVTKSKWSESLKVNAPESKAGEDRGVEFLKWALNKVDEIQEGEDWYDEGCRYIIYVSPAQTSRVKTFEEVYNHFLKIK